MFVLKPTIYRLGYNIIMRSANAIIQVKKSVGIL